jgi:DNA-binding CsgD family transcriptional regulator
MTLSFEGKRVANLNDYMVYLSAKDLASLFQRKQEQTDSVVTWIRSVDFKTQLHLDKNFQNIWQRDCNVLINNPFAFNDFLLPEDREAVISEVSLQNSKFKSAQVIFRILRPDGEIRWIKDTSYYLYDKNNQATAVVGLAESISPDHWHAIRQQQANARSEVAEASTMEKTLIDFLKQSSRFIGERCAYDDLVNKDQPKLYEAGVGDEKIKFSKRENECLQYLMAGMTAKETAKELGISYRTVEEYIENMKIKTESANKYELIVKIKNFNENLRW